MALLLNAAAGMVGGGGKQDRSGGNLNAPLDRPSREATMIPGRFGSSFSVPGSPMGTGMGTGRMPMRMNSSFDAEKSNMSTRMATKAAQWRRRSAATVKAQQEMAKVPPPHRERPVRAARPRQRPRRGWAGWAEQKAGARLPTRNPRAQCVCVCVCVCVWR